MPPSQTVSVSGEPGVDRLRRLGRSALGKRRTLWIGFVAVVIPLVVLLGLQYWWLVDLEHMSTVARQATLKNYLGFVAEQVEFYYRKNAERALDVPVELLNEDPQSQVGHFKKVPHKALSGAHYLFLMSFRGRSAGETVFYDPASQAIATPESVSVYLATLYWQVLAKKVGKVDEESQALFVDERDPDYPIILRPLINDSSELFGVAGLIVDVDYFRDTYLPKLIQKLRPKQTDWDDLAVAVWDGRGREALSSGLKGEQDYEARSHFSFVFTDWEMALGGGGTTSEQLARTNFIFNMTLSLLLAAVLIGGLFLAFRTAAREIRLSEMKGVFVSNVSHELRTPLSSIRVFGELMRLGRVTKAAKIREYGEYIETESRRLTQLINNILDFSKIESGAKVYHFQDQQIDDVVGLVLKTFEVRLKHSGFEIEFSKPEKPLRPVSIDSDALCHAIANLLDNAVKYSNGGRSIAVEVQAEEEFVAVSVRDHGIGISEEEQQRIFDRFHRVSTGLIHDVKGSGLGLSIVKHIVQAHGGQVAVESEVGKGSSFTIRLPLQTDRDEVSNLDLTREDAAAVSRVGS